MMLHLVITIKHFVFFTEKIIIMGIHYRPLEGGEDIDEVLLHQMNTLEDACSNNNNNGIFQLLYSDIC